MTDQPLTDYLTQINSREGLFLWLCMLVSFFVGFLIAYLLRSGKVRRLNRELREVRKKAEDNQILLTSAQEQLMKRNAELQEESREKVALMERTREMEDERQRRLREVVSLNEQLESLRADNLGHAQTVADLNARIVELQDRDPHLPDPATTVVIADGEDTTVEEIGTLRARLNSFEASLERLERENDELRTDLETLKNIPAGSTVVLNDSTEDDVVSEEEPALVIHADKTVLYDKIIVADRDKDDLTRIDGLGEFLEKKLNGLGIFSYDQIASWTPGQIDEITQRIGYIPGRIEKDNWVGQAALLLQSQQDEVATSPYDAVARPTSSEVDEMDDYSRGELDLGTDYVAEVDAAETEEVEAFDHVLDSELDNPCIPPDYAPDNLKIVEGVGPKIEQILKDAGIGNLTTLGGANPGRLREILEEAGDQYRMHNPYTWPLQARLAAAGRWEEFAQYQEELKGGR